MKLIESDITVFCDANTQLNKGAILQLVKHYQDPKVAGVSGEKTVWVDEKDQASAAGEGMYWKYESYLKKMDYRLVSLMGSAGELFSIRTALFKEVEADTILDDFMISMRLVQEGYKVAYEPKAQASESGSLNIQEEFKRKVRIAAGGFQSIKRTSKMFNIFKYGWASFAYVSHRIFRWAVAPFCLLLCLISNLALMQYGIIYWFLAWAQIAFYGMALVGWFFESRKTSIKILYIPFYFSMMNFAVLKGFIRHLKGSQSAMWERSKRK